MRYTHVLFECNIARSMWLCFGLKGDLQVGSGETVQDILRCAFEFLSLDKCALKGWFVGIYGIEEISRYGIK